MINVKYPFNSTFLDYPDNESLSVLIYVMGCDYNCDNCQNENFRDKNNKIETKFFSIEELVVEIKKYTEKAKTNKIVFSGGDPLSEHNIENIKMIVNKLKNKFDICLYTGHGIDYVKENRVEGFKFVKCGTYLNTVKQIPQKKDSYIQFASQNQKLYNSEFKLLSDQGRYYFYRGSDM